MSKLAVTAFVLLAAAAHAQPLRLERLPADRLGVGAPSDRVQGLPGAMSIAPGTCSVRPAQNLRRRIVDIAIQEWAFFGFTVVDQTRAPDDEPGRRSRPRRPRFSWLDASESDRVAGSIAGYWAATADGAWILDRQNAVWNGPDGVAARWRDPWSAAFISWVMCESGLGDAARFDRHIAHHAYIDQAIEARDDPDAQAAFLAYDVGELPVEPGDMLCSARRSAYRSIAERRAQLGVGVRSHCDIVIEVDAAAERVLAIGGNVRGTVSLKLLAARFDPASAAAAPTSIGAGRRTVFAHLKLRAPSIGTTAFRDNPTLEALDDAQRAVLDERLEGEPQPGSETARREPRLRPRG